MCQVLCGELSLVDPHFDLFVDFDEGKFERVVDAAQSGKCSGQARTQDAIVGASEEERGAEAEFGDGVAGQGTNDVNFSRVILGRVCDQVCSHNRPSIRA